MCTIILMEGIASTAHSVVNMGCYMVAATFFHKQSSYFADKMNFLKKNLAPFGLFQDLWQTIY